MKIKDKLTIERALGIIEGAAVGVDEHISSILITAVEMITEVMDKENEGD